MPHQLIEPYGGDLVELSAGAARASELTELSHEWPSWDLNDRQLCDLELLLNGGFSPLTTFMGQADYESVRDDMRLADGTLWPIPIVLDIRAQFAEMLTPGDWIALRDAEGVMLAGMRVDELWQPDLTAQVEAVYGSVDTGHPGIFYILHEVNPWYISGLIEGIRPPVHFDYHDLRLSPADLREAFIGAGRDRIVAFRTRSTMHRAHHELTLRAAEEYEASLLIQPEICAIKPGDIDHYSRVRCYQAMLQHYPEHTAKLALLPLALRLAGPREALLHGIIRRNFGCSHLIVGSDHAGVGPEYNGTPFFEPHEAQNLFRKHEEELGISMIAYEDFVYVEDDDAFHPLDEVPEGTQIQTVSWLELEDRLETGEKIPDWFTFAEIVREMRKNHPPRHSQGFTVFLTGLSGAGKSTIARVLLVKFLELGERPVTLLDGDIVRKNLSSELGFSREHRDLNIHRIGFVASEITKNGGIAICAPIAPYDHIRKANRTLIESVGGYQLVHVSTPIEVCEARDRKGLYSRARAGKIKEFTGVSDPYEVPTDADVVIDTSEMTPEEAARSIIRHLERGGFLRPTVD